ncbi:hypothetical protein [Streptomyces colonosanans]|uniref:hypothetical protein n=1 Tax=Streptomyces colonosanans TaxID=1428652 RepID=UPI00115FC02B|nr:hypothetical protein [Streptomyces colonosanans]
MDAFTPSAHPMSRTRRCSARGRTPVDRLESNVHDQIENLVVLAARNADVEVLNLGARELRKKGARLVGQLRRTGPGVTRSPRRLPSGGFGVRLELLVKSAGRHRGSTPATSLRRPLRRHGSSRPENPPTFPSESGRFRRRHLIPPPGGSPWRS